MKKDKGKSGPQIVEGEGDAIDLSEHEIVRVERRTIACRHGQEVICAELVRRIQFSQICEE